MKFQKSKNHLKILNKLVLKDVVIKNISSKYSDLVISLELLFLLVIINVIHFITIKNIQRNLFSIINSFFVNEHKASLKFDINYNYAKPIIITKKIE